MASMVAGATSVGSCSPYRTSRRHSSRRDRRTRPSMPAVRRHPDQLREPLGRPRRDHRRHGLEHGERRRQRVRRLAHPARVGGLDPEQLQLAADPPLLRARVQPLAVQRRAGAAPRDPLLPRPEVVHVGEHDVGHRVPARDRERERVVRQPALGVLGAVERVDHDEHRIGGVEPEVDAAALLAHGAEPSAGGVQLLEPPEHGRLGRRIDLERAVPALAARPRLTGALRGGRRGGERAAQLVGGCAGGAQPIRCERAHPPYPTKVPVIEERTAQHAAITHAGGPLLILAAAGTGKTHALVERFAWLVAQGPPADAILAFTFSPAAADDLRERIEARVPARYEELSVTTFQAFCARLLREEALEAGIDPFAAPVTPSDRLALLLERIDELPLASHDLRGNPSSLLGSIVQRIDRLKDELVTAGDYEAWASKLPEDTGTERARAEREREFAAIYAAHDRMLAAGGTLDFGDLVLHAFGLLRFKPHVRARLAARFRHVLVDDFQDTSFAQGLLLRLLVGEHGNITVAGDDDQSIDRFRGASKKSIADFRAEWPEAAVVRLTESFRSGGRIVAAAQAVVAPEPERLPKRLEPRPDAPPGDVAFWRCEWERAQAQAVAADVERLVARAEVAPEDVCVLVRSVKGEGQAIAAALEERAVPYRLSGAAAFFQRAEVRDLVAWLRLLVDPGDAGAVVRALARPPIELRAIDLARCTQIARRRKPG